MEVQPTLKLLISIKSTVEIALFERIQQIVTRRMFQSFQKMKHAKPALRILFKIIDKHPKHVLLPLCRQRLIGASTI